MDNRGVWRSSQVVSLVSLDDQCDAAGSSEVAVLLAFKSDVRGRRNSIQEQVEDSEIAYRNKSKIRKWHTETSRRFGNSIQKQIEDSEIAYGNKSKIRK